MCADAVDFKRSEINGSCPTCGEPTVDGEAFEQCSYSPVVCPVCKHAPCDGSC